MNLLDPERDYYNTAMKAKKEKDYNCYLVNLIEACNQNCKEAILEMSVIILDNKFNFTTMIDYFTSTNINNSYSMYILGYMYDYGKVVQQDYPKAIELYKRAIELNNPCAMNNLGYMYKHGRGVQQDYSKAIELYKKAIELNNPCAMNNLAYMYDYGQGVQQNYSKAIELYKKAIELNNSTAMNNLAHTYINGQGVQQDYSKAIELYIKSKNHTKILEILKLVLMDNKGTKNDVENIKKLLVDIDLSQLENIPICITMLQNLLNRNLKMIDMHFEFQEEGIGYKEAKNRFYSYV